MDSLPVAPHSIESNTCSSRPIATAAQALGQVRLESYALMTAAEQIAACEQLARLEARVKAHQFAAARAADLSEAGKAMGATSAAAAIANAFGGDETEAARMVKRAKHLKSGSATEKALANGEVSAAQADLIAGKIDSLRGDPTDAQREGAETQLLDDAKKLKLKDLALPKKTSTPTRTRRCATASDSPARRPISGWPTARTEPTRASSSSPRRRQRC